MSVCVRAQAYMHPCVYAFIRVCACAADLLTSDLDTTAGLLIFASIPPR